MVKNDLVIKEVLEPKDIRAFIKFPRQLYKNSPYYVPPLESDEYTIITGHPALSFCTLRLWMAYRNGEIVGRIAGLINHRHNELKNQKRIRFGWFDTIDDFAVAEALFNTVEEWGKKEKLGEIAGPSRFSNMEKQGMLVDGFDFTPCISCDYNYPYYPQYVERLGFTKDVDYLQFRGAVKPIPPRIENLNKNLLERYNIRIKEFRNKKEMKTYARDFFYALNQTFTDIYNFIPLTEPEIDYLIKTNFTFARKDMVCILVDENDHIVGFSFCLPSLSKAFRKANGKLFPTGWYHIMKAIRKNDVVDMYLTGVLPEWVHRGIHGLYHFKLHETFLKEGFQYAITNQELENNSVTKVWKKYDGEPVTRRRCYIKSLN